MSKMWYNIYEGWEMEKSPRRIYKIDEGKKAALKTEIEADPYIGYIVKAIKYAAGETV